MKVALLILSVAFPLIVRADGFAVHDRQKNRAVSPAEIQNDVRNILNSCTDDRELIESTAASIAAQLCPGGLCTGNVQLPQPPPPVDTVTPAPASTAQPSQDSDSSELEAPESSNGFLASDLSKTTEPDPNIGGGGNKTNTAEPSANLIQIAKNNCASCHEGGNGPQLASNALVKKLVEMGKVKGLSKLDTMANSAHGNLTPDEKQLLAAYINQNAS